jgi:four helix bundle protein
MDSIRTFQDLVCWQLASELSDLIDAMTSGGNAGRDSVFSGQIRKAAMKAPAQIAEAFMRWNAADTANFLRVARASLGETQSHLLKGNRRKYWTEEEFTKAWELSDRTVRVTTGYMRERQKQAGRQKMESQRDRRTPRREDHPKVTDKDSDDGGPVPDKA